MSKETSDFRYNTGATKVPWAAVGENYNADDVMELVKFLMDGEGAEHEAALQEVEAAVAKLAKVSVPPGKLSMGDKVAEVENITVSDEELEAEFAEMAKAYELEIEKIKEMVPTEEIKSNLQTRKTVKFLVDNAVAKAE